jgi:hypothetical protein
MVSLSVTSPATVTSLLSGRLSWMPPAGSLATGQGKLADVFISSGGHGGIPESTAIVALLTFTHHGISSGILGYAGVFAAQLTNLSEG